MLEVWDCFWWCLHQLFILKLQILVVTKAKTTLCPLRRFQVLPCRSPKTFPGFALALTKRRKRPLGSGPSYLLVTHFITCYPPSCNEWKGAVIPHFWAIELRPVISSSTCHQSIPIPWGAMSGTADERHGVAAEMGHVPRRAQPNRGGAAWRGGVAPRPMGWPIFLGWFVMICMVDPRPIRFCYVRTYMLIYVMYCF